MNHTQTKAVKINTIMRSMPLEIDDALEDNRNKVKQNYFEGC